MKNLLLLLALVIPLISSAADSTIHGLPARSTPAGTDLVILDWLDGATWKNAKATLDQVKTFTGGTQGDPVPNQYITQQFVTYNTNNYSFTTNAYHTYETNLYSFTTNLYATYSTNLYNYVTNLYAEYSTNNYEYVTNLYATYNTNLYSYVTNLYATYSTNLYSYITNLYSTYITNEYFYTTNISAKVVNITEVVNANSGVFTNGMTNLEMTASQYAATDANNKLISTLDGQYWTNIPIAAVPGLPDYISTNGAGVAVYDWDQDVQGSTNFNPASGYSHLQIEMSGTNAYTFNLQLETNFTGFKLLSVYAKWDGMAPTLQVRSASSNLLYEFEGMTNIAEGELKFLGQNGSWKKAGPNIVYDTGIPGTNYPSEPDIAAQPETNGLVLWLAAGDLAYNRPDGGVVINWYDRTALANNATSVGNSNKTTLLKNAIATNRSAIKFDTGGGGAYTIGKSLFSGSAASTYFVVHKTLTNGAISPLLGVGDALVNGTWRMLQARNFGGVYGDPYAAGYGADLSAGPIPQTNVWRAASLVYSNGTTAYIHTNGVLAASGAKTWNTGTGNFKVGYEGAAGAEVWFSGQIAELLVYTNALNATQISNTFYYLNSKYYIY